MDVGNKREELNREIKKAKQERLSAASLIRGLAEITEEPVLQYRVATLDLTDKFTDISFSMETITEEQYKELTNVVQQLNEIFDNYIKENNIKIQER